VLTQLVTTAGSVKISSVVSDALAPLRYRWSILSGSVAVPFVADEPSLFINPSGAQALATGALTVQLEVTDASGAVSLRSS
jgi:hypothetical protein